MQQKSFTKQSRSRTRNQRKREFIRTLCMSIAALLLSVMVLTMMVKAFVEHPAEQPISYAEHMAAIGGDSCGNFQD